MEFCDESFLYKQKRYPRLTRTEGGQTRAPRHVKNVGFMDLESLNASLVTSTSWNEYI